LTVPDMATPINTTGEAVIARRARGSTPGWIHAATVALIWRDRPMPDPAS
jgi:hypothetical protein